MAGRQPAVLRRFLIDLVVWGCWCNHLASSAEVVLYDNFGKTELNFDVYPSGSWTQVSYLSGSSDVIEGMRVCTIGDGGNISNWFRLPYLAAPGVDLLYIRLQFIMRDCLEYPNVVKQCKQVFGLLKSEASPATVPTWDVSPTGYALVQNVAADSTYRNETMATINTKEVALSKNAASPGLHVSFRDEGTCVQIIGIVVLYKQCPQMISNLVAFDASPASDKPYPVIGRCVANAVVASSGTSSASPLLQFCSNTGEWLQTVQLQCVCTAGYSPTGSSGTGCSACNAGTYKAASGNGRCTACPPGSSAPAPGTSICTCNVGLYRADGEDGSVACTGPPSQMRMLTTSEILSDRVTLRWLPPAVLGGRTDVRYSVACDVCQPSAVTYAPGQTGLTVTQVTIFGLTPGTAYNFTVSATNGVTAKAVASGVAGTATASIAVTTYSSGSAPTTDSLSARQFNSTAITLSWTAVPFADTYVVAYRPADAATYEKSVNSTSPTVTVAGLQPATAYYFKVTSYEGGMVLKTISEASFSTAASDSELPPTIIAVAVVSVVVGMGIVLVIVVVVMITLARRGSNSSESRSVSCTAACKALHRLLSKSGCCSKRKQTSYNSSLPWRTSSSVALAGSNNSSTAAFTGPYCGFRHGLSAAADADATTPPATAPFAAAAAVDQTVPPSPVTPCMPSADTSSAAPLFLPGGGGPGGAGSGILTSSSSSVVGSFRRRLHKTYVDPHTYEDPRNAVREFAREIDASCITIESVIGGGEFGDVCRGVLRLPGAPDVAVAIKTLKGGASEKSRLDFLTEASIMGQFNDPNIIYLEGVVTKTNPIMIVTEFMENGSLDTFLKANDGCLSLAQLLGMLRGIASGMRYLSDMSYVHRDLAARNILVSATLVCKVADFGLSREVEYNESEGAYTTRGGKIPVRWTSPEAIAYRKFTSASDVWSYGVVMWEVMSYGERPYWDWSNQDVIKAVEQDYRLPAPMDCPVAIHQLMLNCWQKDRSLRPRFANIVQVLDKLMRSKDLLQSGGGRMGASPPVGGAVDEPEPFGYANQPPASGYPQHAALRSWLDAIGLGCYFAAFATHGYVTFEGVAALTPAALEAIGVVHDSHRAAIMAAVRGLGRGTSGAAHRTFDATAAAAPVAAAAGSTSSVGFLV